MSAWANRKAAVQAEAETLAKAEHDASVAEQHATLLDKPEADVLTELDLPNPDNMQAGDDFSAFMKETVPAALRNRALRRLWTSNPLLANVDMLVDYGEDFTGASDPVGLVKTIYRVGKGMLPDEEESPAELDPAKAEACEAPAEDTEEMVQLEATEIAPLPEPDAPAIITPRRRMRFEFEDGALPSSSETEMT